MCGWCCSYCRSGAGSTPIRHRPGPTEPTAVSTVEREALPDHVHDAADYVPAEGLDVGALLHVALQRDGAVDVIMELVQLRNDEMDRQAAMTFGRAFVLRGGIIENA